MKRILGNQLCDRTMNGAIAHVLVTLTPIFLVIRLGYALRMRLITRAEFWDGAEKLTYYMFLPALLVSGIVRTELGAIALSEMALGLAGGTLLTALCARLPRPLLGPAPPPIRPCRRQRGHHHRRCHSRHCAADQPVVGCRHTVEHWRKSGLAASAYLHRF